MKTGIIADSLESSFTGIGNYAYNLLKNLHEVEGNNEYVVICSNYNTLIPLKYNILIVPKFRFFCGKEIRKFVILPYRLNGLNFDVVHDTYHFGPSLFSSTYRKVVTIFDLSPYLFRETHRLSTVLAHKYLLPLILKKSQCIIAISNSTKQDLIKHFKIPDNKIKVIHLAADEKFQPLDNEITQIFKTKYNLNFPFILYVGTLEPRKNIPTLIKAFYNLKKYNLPHKLVIAGKKGWKYKSIYETIEKLEFQDDVIFTGYVPDEDLRRR